MIFVEVSVIKYFPDSRVNKIFDSLNVTILFFTNKLNCNFCKLKIRICSILSFTYILKFKCTILSRNTHRLLYFLSNKCWVLLYYWGLKQAAKYQRYVLNDWNNINIIQYRRLQKNDFSFVSINWPSFRTVNDFSHKYVFRLRVLLLRKLTTVIPPIFAADLYKLLFVFL